MSVINWFLRFEMLAGHSSDSDDETAKNELLGARYRTVPASVDGSRNQETWRINNTHSGCRLHVPGPRHRVRRLLRLESG